MEHCKVIYNNIFQPFSVDIKVVVHLEMLQPLDFTLFDLSGNTSTQSFTSFNYIISYHIFTVPVATRPGSSLGEGGLEDLHTSVRG